jgi:hypothetical protein
MCSTRLLCRPTFHSAQPCPSWPTTWVWVGQLGQRPAAEGVDLDHTVSELARRHAKQPEGAEQAESDLDAGLSSTVLGEDRPVVEAGHERGVPIGDELGGELHVDRLAEA